MEERPKVPVHGAVGVDRGIRRPRGGAWLREPGGWAGPVGVGGADGRRSVPSSGGKGTGKGTREEPTSCHS